MAAKLQCEICGGKLIGRPGGVFECDSCGMEYDTAWAKEKIQEITGTVKVEGTVEVTGKVQVDGPVKVEGGINKEALLKRGRLALEDGQWDSAKEFFDQALSLDAEYADAWLGLAMSEMHLRKEAEFAFVSDGSESVEKKADYQKFLRFASEERKQEIGGLIDDAEREKQKREAAEEMAREAFRKWIAPAQRMIAAGYKHAIGLMVDGEVKIAGAEKQVQSKISNWSTIIAITAGHRSTIGLKADGTVVVADERDTGRCEASDWKNVVETAAGASHIVGLKTDGTVVAVGDSSFNRGQCDVINWQDIVTIDAGGFHTVGLKANGTVVAAGDNAIGQCCVSDWKDIVAIAAGWAFTVALKADGTVAATVIKDSKFDHGQSSVDNWKNIVAIAAGTSHTVGLKYDGTVVAVGDNKNDQCDVFKWENIVAIAAGGDHTIGLKADGTVVITGSSNIGRQHIVSGWKLFDSIDTLELERRAAKEKAEANRRAAAEKAEAESKTKIASLETEQAALNEELKNLKGLFSGKRRKEIEARLAEIAAELERLG